MQQQAEDGNDAPVPKILPFLAESILKLDGLRIEEFSEFPEMQIR